MHERLDVADLVNRAKEGAVSTGELRAIADRLEDGAGSDTYRLLYVIARMGAREYEELLAGYMRYSEDPQVAALALSVLCVQWERCHLYRDRLLDALAGVPWDQFDELKQAAISAAGEYLRSANDLAVFQLLLETAEVHEVSLEGKFAIEALARALGEPRSDATYPRDPAKGRAWAQGILNRAQGRAKTELAHE
jgi:hypothetical protein